MRGRITRWVSVPETKAHNERNATRRENSQSWGRTYLLISELSGCGPQCAHRECDAGMALSAPTASHCCWKSRGPAENGILCPRLCPPQNCLLAEKLNQEGVDVNITGTDGKIFFPVFYLGSSGEKKTHALN